MKAEFISEKLNFERNPYDPLRSMGIGHKKTLPELIALYKKVLQLNMGHDRKEFANEIGDCIPNRFLADCGWGNAFKIFDELSDEELDKFDRVTTKYYNMFKSTNEAANFERGGTPLEKMKIGGVHSIEKLTDIYTELVNNVQRPKWQGGKNYDLQLTLIPEMLTAIPRRYKNSNGWGNMDQFFHELSHEEYYTIDKIVTKYYNKLKK
jgi:hypothetical protein